MKRLKFLVQVTDKNTKEKYKAGQIVEFEDERANAILLARRPDGKEYAKEVKNIEKEIAKKVIDKETAIKKIRKTNK